VRVGGRLLILDAGTGIRALGASLTEPLDADLLLTHTHVDHICGIPFFGPLFRPANRVVMWAGHLIPDYALPDVLADYMAAPLFPIKPGVFRAAVEYRDFRAGDDVEVRPGLVVRTAPLNHPNGATGYRIHSGSRALAYVTDTEHEPGAPDANVLDLVRGADLMIYDSTYTDEEFPAYRTWGHSTWQEGVRIADAAGVRTLVIFHHDPGHDDAFMDQVALEAEAARPGTLVAREGMTLTV
jgi:phosphoribosyl 1,2-cyclic phosphodiesterase